MKVVVTKDGSTAPRSNYVSLKRCWLGWYKDDDVREVFTRGLYAVAPDSARGEE